MMRRAWRLVRTLPPEQAKIMTQVFSPDVPVAEDFGLRQPEAGVIAVLVDYIMDLLEQRFESVKPQLRKELFGVLAFHKLMPEIERIYEHLRKKIGFTTLKISKPEDMSHEDLWCQQARQYLKEHRTEFVWLRPEYFDKRFVRASSKFVGEQMKRDFTHYLMNRVAEELPDFLEIPRGVTETTLTRRRAIVKTSGTTNKEG
jgi:hypothetical protein